MAAEFGFEKVRELRLRSSETVYLLIADTDEVIGIPMYLHYVNDMLMASNYEQSMALFDEPEFMEDTR